MDAGASFTVEETNVDAICEGEDDYRLVGYGVGATPAEPARRLGNGERKPAAQEGADDRDDG